MSQSLTLPDELFNKLADGAAQRGLTIEALLDFVSELVVLPERPTQQERARLLGVERLFAKYKAGPLSGKDRAELDRLIDEDYEDAIARADKLIAAKEEHPNTSKSASTSKSHTRSSTGSAKRSRK